MMYVSPEFFESASENARERYIDRVLAHVQEFFPERCQKLGAARTRDAVCYGLERGESYDLTSELDLCKFVDVMFTLGPRFDEDPEWSWTAGVLGAFPYDSTDTRMEEVFQKVVLRLREREQAAANQL